MVVPKPTFEQNMVAKDWLDFHDQPLQPLALREQQKSGQK